MITVFIILISFENKGVAYFCKTKNKGTYNQHRIYCLYYDPKNKSVKAVSTKQDRFYERFETVLH